MCAKALGQERHTGIRLCGKPASVRNPVGEEKGTGGELEKTVDRHSAAHLWPQLLRSLRCKDHLSPAVQDQPGTIERPHLKTKQDSRRNTVLGKGVWI